MNKSYAEQFKQVILRCKKDPIFFIENFCKVKHPKAGVIPFKLFKYQKNSIKDFLKYRFNLYRKTRQSGISTVSGAFALWYAMFYNHKTILIVSKRDDDAMAFLAKNVKLVYENLPLEFRQLWGNLPKTYNEHEIEFPNGSIIRSLTSGPETLRSYSSSLNIIDEAAFMPHMATMWAGGWSTLMHGGSVICISTTNGCGGWYHTTWEDAINGNNQFHPIVVNWWDMDWQIEYTDDVTNKKSRICPVDGIRKCTTKEEIEKYGQYWSPWLEEQYRQLQQKGEAHKFRQEVLAEFIGSGDTVLSRSALLHVQGTVSDKFQVVGQVPYTHPVSGERMTLDFENRLWVWHRPVKPQPDVIENGRVIKPGLPGHAYTMGVDISSGEADDFSGIEVIDCNTLQQVAELYIKVEPAVLLMMMDYIGRWYNTAYIVPERTGLGIPVCQDLYHSMAYVNIYRMKQPSGKTSRKVGFPTSPAYKPMINKCLLDNVGSDGVELYSSRLLQQLQIYINMGGGRTGHVEGPGNHSDLAIALGLGLLGISEAVQSDQRSLIPAKHGSEDEDSPNPTLFGPDALNAIALQGGINALMPFAPGLVVSGRLSPREELDMFTRQLGGIPIGSKESIRAFHKQKNVVTYLK